MPTTLTPEEILAKTGNMLADEGFRGTWWLMSSKAKYGPEDAKVARVLLWPDDAPYNPDKYFIAYADDVVALYAKGNRDDPLRLY